MRPSTKTGVEQVLEWATSIIEREQKAETYGTVIVYLEKGRIVRAKVERSEKPPEL